MAREFEADRRPVASPSGSFVVNSGTQLGAICHKCVVNVTTTLTSFNLRTLDGTQANMGAVPVGLYQFDIQHDLVTWVGGSAVAVSYYHITGG